ncbi:MAG: metallophosphoesterase [Verrucomicrobiaceae bacterium]|nr:metallophosphoesterase [Verrucomicrobiaceae bacterium]
MTRRDLFTTALAAPLTAYIYGRSLERHVLTTEKITLSLPHLEDELAGLRIIQISDLHLRPYTPPEFIAKTVQEVNALEPDIIAITGDFITRDAKDAGELADILSALKSRYGTYGVMGNHDCWHQPLKVLLELKRGGVQMLVNDGHPLLINGAPLWIGGVDSAWAGKPDLTRALPKANDIPTILLAHEPDYADEVIKADRHLIQLSGHSHGGQVRAPLWGEIVHVSWAKKYVCGHYDLGKVKLYVNRGIGCVSHPVRFACPPEITEITLAREV